MFNNLMLYAGHLFLKNGVLESKSECLDKKKLKGETSEEFVQFAKSHLLENEKYNKKEIFDLFVEMYGFYHLNQTSFTMWVRIYADFINLKMIDSHSGNNDFFMLSK
jgi:hypothetical protein